MPVSSNIHSYSDVAAVLAEALPHGFATYRLETIGAATHWIQRANKYRLLLQKAEAAKAGVKGFQPPTPYDRMKLIRKGTDVEINFNPQPKGELSLPSGQVLKPKAQAVETYAASAAPPKPFAPKTTSLSDLEFAAMQLAAEVGDDE